ncbi:MAG: hypothetical protein UU76_C0003G0020 [Parcubacteria group bacterium GW2011_GWC1_41_7]|nr:MAG: hypothetical protein UU76_C0003G0020 [Parcubacteria group bacterium GW2011_GWC1_41_7]
MPFFSFVYAQNQESAVGLIQQYCTNSAGIQQCLQGLYNAGVMLAIAIAFLMVVYGAFKYIIGAAGNTKAAGKQHVQNAVMGVAFIFISGTILYWVNPSIFNAELILYNVKKLKVPTAGITLNSYGGAGGGSASSGNLSYTEPPAPSGTPIYDGEIWVTNYYGTTEGEGEQRGGYPYSSPRTFPANFLLQGSGLCEGGSFLSKRNEHTGSQINQKIYALCNGYNGWINVGSGSGPQKVSGPTEACGNIIGLGVVAVPAAWHTSIVEFYSGTTVKRFYGTDRGGAINDHHIDIYTGVGFEAIAALPSFAQSLGLRTSGGKYYLRGKVYKLNNGCNASELMPLKNSS